MGLATVDVTEELWKLCGPQSGTIIQVVSNDVPPDAVIEGCGYNLMKAKFVITLSSPSIPDVGEDSPLPKLLGPVFRLSDLGVN